MANQSGSHLSQSGSGQRGGPHEQHVKAGEQSHKNDAARSLKAARATARAAASVAVPMSNT
ncbi:hypothetical protein J2Y51_004314 [Bosea sp. BE109]|jgi:hypothetical protein|nr:hypothetical protein [Bosea sp. BE109]MDR7140673.1 hypothetical protein [Bosea sp. BE168]